MNLVKIHKKKKVYIQLNRLLSQIKINLKSVLHKSFYFHYYAGIFDLKVLPEMIISMASKQILT